MSSFSERIQTGNDNGYWAGSWIPNAAANVGIGKNFFGQTVYSAFRFPNVTIPQGATIDAATIELIGDETQTLTINFTYKGIAEDNTASLSSDPGGRAKTSAGVNTTIVNNTNNASHVSPDISSIIQEIINRGGWVSGNALAIITQDNGTSNDNIIRHYSYAGDSSKAALLTITYHTATTTSTTTTSTSTTSTSTTTTSTSTTTLPREGIFYGLKIFKKDAPDTLSPRNFYLNSKDALLPIHDRKSFRATYIRFSGLHISVPIIGLNYRPRVWVYMQRMQHTGVLDPNYHLLEWSYWGATKIGFQSVKVYNDHFLIDYQDDLVDDLSINFSVLGYYYIFKKEIKA